MGALIAFLASPVGIKTVGSILITTFSLMTGNDQRMIERVDEGGTVQCYKVGKVRDDAVPLIARAFGVKASRVVKGAVLCDPQTPLDGGE